MQSYLSGPSFSRAYVASHSRVTVRCLWRLLCSLAERRRFPTSSRSLLDLRTLRSSRLLSPVQSLIKPDRARCLAAMPVELLPFPPAYCVGASPSCTASVLARCADEPGGPLSTCTVGAYRLLTDPQLYLPIWQRSRKSLQRALLLAVPYSLVALPLTRLYVTFILSRSPLSPRNIHDAALLGVSPVRYTTWMLLLGQVSMLVEWLLSRQLRKSRDEVYEATVRSRGKGALSSLWARFIRLLTSTFAFAAPDFWQPYTEEWLVPPIERARRAAEKQSFYVRLSSPLVRTVLLKGALKPLSQPSVSPTPAH